MDMVYIKVQVTERQVEVKISIQNLDLQPELVHQAILGVVVIACLQINFQTHSIRILTLNHALMRQERVVKILKDLNRQITCQF